VLLTRPLNEVGAPGMVGAPGHECETTIAGLLETGQVTLAVSLAATPAQLSAAVAVAVVVKVQVSVGTGDLNVKLTAAPGRSVGAVKTGVPGENAFTTTIFVTVTLPLFTTDPE